MTAPIHYTDVLAARDRLRPFFGPSPVRQYPLLDELVGYGISVFVKHENHLPTGSFKVRNGTASITALSAEQAERGVIAATTGNHGLGLAWAGAAHGVSVTICVPKWNNPEKNDGIRAFGATLIEVGDSYDETVVACRAIAEQEQRTIVHSTNHREVLSGAGTMSAEFLEQVPDLDAIVIALGGGSQAVGALVVSAEVRPVLKVYAVQSQGASAQHDAWHDGDVRSGAPVQTFADGIATGSTYDLTFGTLRAGLADFVLSSDTMIAQAVRDLWRTTHNLAEGSGATGLAGLRLLAPQLAGQRVGIVMCGGNLDTQRAAVILGGGTPGV